MRHKYSGVFRDGAGNIVSGGTVSVYLAGTGTTAAASIYTTATGATAVNTVTSGTDGTFTFYVDRFDYDRNQQFKVVLNKTNFTEKSYDYIEIKDLITGTYAISADKTVSTDLGRIPEGIIYQPANGVTLTFNGSLNAGRYRLFDTSLGGTIAFGANATDVIYPEWLAADTTEANMTLAITAANAAANGREVVLGAGDYAVTSITLDNCTLTGQNPAYTRLFVAADSTITIQGNSTSNMKCGKLRNLSVQGAVGTTTSAVKLTGQVFRQAKVLDNVRIRAATNGTDITTGSIGIHFDVQSLVADQSTYVAGNSFGTIIIEGFEKGFYAYANKTLGTDGYITSNVFDCMMIMNSKYLFVSEGAGTATVSRNIWNALIIQPQIGGYTVDGITIIGGTSGALNSRNYMALTVWDWTAKGATGSQVIDGGLYNMYQLPESSGIRFNVDKLGFKSYEMAYDISQSTDQRFLLLAKSDSTHAISGVITGRSNYGISAGENSILANVTILTDSNGNTFNHWEAKGVGTSVSPKIVTLTLQSSTFNTGTTEPAAGTHYYGETSGAEIIFHAVYLSSGSWTGDDAVGTIRYEVVSGTVANGEHLHAGAGGTGDLICNTTSAQTAETWYALDAVVSSSTTKPMQNATFTGYFTGQTHQFAWIKDVQTATVTSGTLGAATKHVVNKAVGPDTQEVYTASTTLTDAQVNAATTAVTLLPAPGVGNIYEVISVMWIFNRGSAAFTLGGTPATFSIRYDVSNIDIFATMAGTGFLDGAADGIRWQHPTWTETTDLVGGTTSVNRAIELINTATASTVGTGSTLKVILTYKVHATGL